MAIVFSGSYDSQQESAFSLWRLEQIAVHVRGNAEGCMEVAADAGFEKLICSIPVRVHTNDWHRFADTAEAEDGVSALYFRFRGDGALDFLEMELACSTITSTVFILPPVLKYQENKGGYFNPACLIML